MTSAIADPFTALHRALLRRRLAQLDPRVRGEVLLLAVGVNAFIFWQTRIPLDGMHRAHGEPAVVRALVVGLGLLVVTGAALAGTRAARLLAGAMPGPEWLALPVTPAALLRHLAWEARLQCLWAAAAAPGFLIAAHGLVPAWMLGALAAAFLAALGVGAHAATAAAMLARGARAGGDAWRPLMERTVPRPQPQVRPPRWRAAPRWRVIVLRDLKLLLRARSVRSSVLAAIAWTLASAGVWFTPLAGPTAQFLGFGLALIAAYTWAEVLILLGAEDPPGLMRSLPTGPRALWTARAIEALAGAAVLALLQLVLAHIEPGPRALQAACVFAAALALGLLGAQYGITIGRQAAIARRFLVLTTSIAMAASLMITLLGWFILIAGVVHSAVRLPRWWSLEETR